MLRAVDDELDTSPTTTGEIDDALLIDARRDADAFGKFYSRNVDRILGYFWRHTRDRDVTSDLTAEVFAALLERLDQYDPSRGNTSQWMFGIASNHLKKFWRRQKTSNNARNRLAITTPPTARTGWQAIEAADARLDADRLRSALERLPPKYRDAVEYRIIDQLDYADIGTKLDCTPETARVRVFRGLQRLEAEFESPTDKGGMAQ